jgi:hypothetical protein
MLAIVPHPHDVTAIKKLTERHVLGMIDMFASATSRRVQPPRDHSGA